MFRAKRQGVELTTNAIIIMALALIVLAIIAFLIIRSVGKANEATNCEDQGGKCVGTLEPCPDTDPITSANYCSDKAKPKCCSHIEGLTPTAP